MTETIVKIITEVLAILAIATTEIKQRRLSEAIRNLAICGSYSFREILEEASWEEQN